MSILPREAYLSLSAQGYCDIQGKKTKYYENKYRLYRDKKTEITMRDGSVHRACIVFADDGNYDIATNTMEGDKPRQDQTVMEYLLIKSDEQKYLDTAILTQIMGPPNHRSGASIQALWRDEQSQWGQIMPRIGDVIQIRRPQTYLIPQAVITQTCLHLLSTHDLLRGLRWPLIRHDSDQWNRPNRSLTEELRFGQNDLTLTLDEFTNRHLRLPLNRMATYLAANRNIRAVVELDLPQGLDMASRSTDHAHGLSIRLTRAFDIRDYRYVTRLEIGLIVDNPAPQP